MALVQEDGVIREARVALGGVGTVPWRAWDAEDVLRDAPADPGTFLAAARAALGGTRPLPGTAFKVELAQRTLIRTLETVAGAES
ncbi:hypothetical protein RB196_30765 [Streptomyces sp. PmtA]